MIGVFIALCAAYIGVLVYDRVRARTLFSQVHIQGKTENDEVMDFTVSLFTDESADEWQLKLNTAFGLREKRLQFQNDRMQELIEQARKQDLEARANKQGVPLKLTDKEMTQ